jgi:radical SAM superfamily enzyme YgiQ (UPF0313 family)
MEDTGILHDHGFWVHGMFVFGPQQNRRSADQIVDFARAAKLESLQISILTPLPGTPLFDQMRPHLIFRDFPRDWDYFDGTHCVYDNGRLGVEGTQRAVLGAHKRFYRWGGLSVRRLRAMVEQKMPYIDKIALIWNNARIALTMMKQWGHEMKEFLHEVGARRQLAATVEPVKETVGRRR